MRLAIADPPYLGRAEMFYGTTAITNTHNANSSARINPVHRGDAHADAAVWDDPATHEALVARLIADYDGWAIAMVPDNLREYLRWTPRRTRVAVWHDPQVMPNGCHPRRRWEPVLVYVPDGRLRVNQVRGPHVEDVHRASHPSGGRFAGAKPRSWTRWVLNMMGYDPDVDTVDDLFPGSGLVQAEIDQGVLRWAE